MRLLLVISALLISAHSVHSQGIDFFKGKWDQALAKAKEEGKVIFVDAYAVWCGPCKRMSKYVFTDESVGAFYNKHFINVKMDMERGEGLEFRKEYPISAFPTLYYIAPDGDVIHGTKGARQAEAFIQLGKKVLNKFNPVSDYKEKYEKGNRDYELIYNYVKALNRAGESSLKVSNDYLDSVEDYTTEQNLKFILEATTEADSKIFELLIEHRDQIEGVTSAQAVKSRIKYACSRTAAKAIEFEAPALIEEAVQKMEEHYPEESDFFESDAWLSYYEEVGTREEYLDQAEDFIKDFDRDRPNEVINLCEYLLNEYKDSEQAMEIAEDGAKKAARKSDNHEFHFIHARILNEMSERDDALDALDEAIELAGEQGDKESMKNYQAFKKILKKKS